MLPRKVNRSNTATTGRHDTEKRVRCWLQRKGEQGMDAHAFSVDCTKKKRTASPVPDAISGTATGQGPRIHKITVGPRARRFDFFHVGRGNDVAPFDIKKWDNEKKSSTAATGPFIEPQWTTGGQKRTPLLTRPGRASPANEVGQNKNSIPYCFCYRSFVAPVLCCASPRGVCVCD